MNITKETNKMIKKNIKHVKKTEGTSDPFLVFIKRKGMKYHPLQQKQVMCVFITEEQR